MLHSAHKRNKMFSDRAIRAAGPTLWNSLNNKLKNANRKNILEINICTNQI